MCVLVCVLIVCDLETSTLRRPKNELRFSASQEIKKVVVCQQIVSTK